MKHFLILMSLAYFLGSISSNSVSRNCNELFDGWTVENGTCIYKEDLNRCQNPFNFQSSAECQRDLTGCSVPDICKNHGFCVSVKTFSGARAFKCMCYATGYYGKTCQSRCSQAFPRERNYPIACIQI